MLDEKLKFIKDYMSSKNAADGSKYDANANVTNKNLCTLQSELFKKETIQINRKILFNKIEELYSTELANEYIRQLETHEIYAHDETSLLPYCVSISMYPLLVDGLKGLGGESNAPKHLASFCGNFINMIFAISAQFAGAVASVEFLMYMDYFAKKDFGENYIETHQKELESYFQQVVYSINQPAAARNYQSVFWNISIYDEYYFDSLFGDFVFPDFTKPEWSTIEKIQGLFMTWFNNERKKEVLTFPIVTAAMLIEEDKPKDETFARMCSKNLADGNSFFMYLSESADSLASCCRLRNEFQDNTFSYTLGAGGVSTGSINVITINMNRLIQDGRDLKDQIEKIHKYHHAYREIIIEFQKAGLLTVYDAGFISLDKQYSTIGINGMAEAAEFLGIDVNYNEEYINFVTDNLKVIYDLNKEAKKEFGFMFNTEFVPAENLGVKNANWDKKDNYVVNRECYNSYFYLVEDEELNHLDKFLLHGKKMTQFLDGGSALHLNLEEYLTEEGFYKLICVSAKTGCNYFCTNVKITICNDCNHIDKRTTCKCEKCNSQDIDYGTRIIGYLKRVSAFSSQRQKEHTLRFYHKENS